jgi:hypothetical protein
MLPNLFLSSESCFSEFRPVALCRAPVFFAVTLPPYAASAVFLTIPDARQRAARFSIKKIAHHCRQSITVSGKQLYSSIHALVAGVSTRHPRRSTTTVSSMRRPNAPGM